jgi:HEAT repeat protein
MRTGTVVHDESAKLRELAREVLSDLVHSLGVYRLPELDVAVRGSPYGARQGWDAWTQLNPAVLDQLPQNDHAPALLALLTMHGNGFVREAAVRRLADRAPEFAFPYVLLRANDWVAKIRDLSTTAVLDFLRSGREQTVARSLPFILKFDAYGRGEHGPLLDALRNYLRAESASDALFVMLTDPDVEMRRSVVRFLNETREPVRRSFVEHASTDRDAIVRRWAARQLEAIEPLDPTLAASLRSRMVNDSSSAIRREAIYSLVRIDPSGATTELTKKLLDPAAAVRYTARYYLREAGAPQDFADYYRQCLHGRSRQLVAAITGLAETGSADDAKVMEQFLTHPSSKVVRAALSAQARLDAQHTRRQRLAALVDHRCGVVRHASRLLGRRLAAADADVLRGLAEGVATPDAANALAQAASRLPVWINLITLLSLCAFSDERVTEAALAQLAIWEPRDRPGYAVSAPDIAMRRELVTAIRETRNSLPLPIAVRLDRLLEPYLMDRRT